MTMRQPKCGTDARCEGYWADCGVPANDVPELVSGDNLTEFIIRDVTLIAIFDICVKDFASIIVCCTRVCSIRLVIL